MKKLIVTLEYPPDIGGIATYTDQFAEALDSEEVVVLAPPAENSEEHDQKKDFKIYRRKFYYPKFFWPRWLQLFFAIRGIVKEEDIDIIYLHHIIPVGYVAWMIKKLMNIPYLIFSHGIDIVSATRSGWKKMWVKKVVGQSERVIMNSKSLEERLHERLPETEDKTTVLYPCPEQQFKQKPDQKKIKKLKNRLSLEGKQVMLTVGRLIKGKGVEYLVKLMPEILKQRPHLVWVIVGSGPQEEEIKKRIRKYNLQNVVRFVGSIEHNSLPDYYHMADLFAVPTHPYHGLEEGLGLVFLEAAAAGVPVVAGESGGVSEAVVDGKTGYVVKTFRDDEVIEKITELLDDKELAREMGSKAAQRIEEKFVWQKQLKKIDKYM